MGLANALAALNAGIDRFDASLGGCPYAPGASGNICTEDLVHMFQRMGLNTGVDLDRLLQCAADLPQLVGHDVPGSVLKAGKADRRYPRPKWKPAFERGRSACWTVWRHERSEAVGTDRFCCGTLEITCRRNAEAWRVPKAQLWVVRLIEWLGRSTAMLAAGLFKTFTIQLDLDLPIDFVEYIHLESVSRGLYYLSE